MVRLRSGISVVPYDDKGGPLPSISTVLLAVSGSGPLCLSLRARDTAQAMSQENVELARRGFEAWEQGDLETHLSLIHEDVTCRQVGQIDAETYHGLEGYIEFASQWLEPYEELEFRPSEFMDAGDKVVVEVPQEGRLVGSDQPITGTFWFVITARDGKMAHLEIYNERDPALEAAGLRE